MDTSDPGGAPQRDPVSVVEIWKLIISGVAAFTTVGSLAYGIWTYLDQRADQIAQRSLEIEQRGLEIEAMLRDSKKRFLDKQFELYVETVSTVSRLTTQRSYDGREDDLVRFWELYWGELGMVEDDEVERAMSALGMIIPDLDTDLELAKRASLNLSHCVKTALGDSWGVDLGERVCLTYGELMPTKADQRW